MDRVWTALLMLCCWSALQGIDLNRFQAADELFFSEFKRDPLYGKYYEPVSNMEGGFYVEAIKMQFKELLAHFNQFKTNDEIGNPKTFFYNKLGRFSPSTLRWIYTAACLKKHFPNLGSYKVLYFGAGYGGVCKILADLGVYPDLTLVQAEGEAVLCEKYLHRFGVYNASCVPRGVVEDGAGYDLVIVDSDFIDRYWFDEKFEELIREIPNGFIIKRGVAQQFNPLVKDLIALGKRGAVYPELLHDENVRQELVWKDGGDDDYDPLPAEVFLEPSFPMNGGTAITNEVTQHRFGDQLVTYFRAKWVSRKMQIPFIFTPFELTENFVLRDVEKQVQDGFRFKKKKTIVSLNQIDREAASTMWILPFVPASRYEYLSQKRALPFVEVDWEHPEMKKMVLEMLELKRPVEEIRPPDGVFSIALHLRRGGMFKPDEVMKPILPLKFPPDAFMIQQLKRVAALVPELPLYVHIFTDDPDPAGLARYYKQQWNEPRAQFDFRAVNLPMEKEQILSDFYSFKNFDCLIRPESHFSLIAGKLGDFTIEICPAHYMINENDEAVIDQSELKFSGQLTE